MKTVVINGKFMADRMQGIVRYARELCKSIDKLDNSFVRWILATPYNAHDVPVYTNIEVVKVGNHTGIMWEQTDLRKFLKKNHDAVCLNFCNVAPLGVKPGITTIHDIMYKVNPQDYQKFRNRISRMWHCFQYSYVCKHEKIILTDSMYSKSEIEKYYPKSKGKIQVIPCGWQHILDYRENARWNEAYPFLKRGEFYFSLSTLAKNKNGQWIIEAAKRNPTSVFAIAGKYYESDVTEIPDNVHMLGFISDEDACALIKNCKAFIHPALYEGFGLPPLEALGLGTQVISANTTSLPEVLGNSAHYIDPNNPDVNLEKLLENPIAPANEALARFDWKESAKILYEIMCSC